jgi:hypothetical protein
MEGWVECPGMGYTTPLCQSNILPFSVLKEDIPA